MGVVAVGALQCVDGPSSVQRSVARQSRLRLRHRCLHSCVAGARVKGALHDSDGASRDTD